jgi:hypothetical protein
MQRPVTRLGYEVVSRPRIVRMFDKLDIVASWSEFSRTAPALAGAIRGTLHQYGPGLAYLATVGPGGAPRLHPVSPAVTDDGLFVCVLDTPKRHDLQRDGRFALHAFPPEDCDDEACVRGQARLVTDPLLIRRVAAAMNATAEVDWWLFELDVQTAIFVSRPDGRGPAVRQVWHAPTRRRHRARRRQARPGTDRDGSSRQTSAHAAQISSGITPAFISTPKILQPTQYAKTDSSVAATATMPSST